MLAEILHLADEQLASSQCEMADVRRILVDAVAHLMRERCDGAVDRQTVTALQFQDLSDQLLAHAMRRLEVLRDEIGRVRLGMAVPNGGEAPSDWPSIADAVRCSLAVSASRSDRPVAAADLKPGTVEIF